MKKMKIKKNDKVLVIHGKDRGKKGKVVQVLPDKGQIVVENVNKRFRHVRPKKEGEKGQRVEFVAPIDVSNAMVICPKCNEAVRLSLKKVKDGKKVRVCRKCSENV